MEIRRALLLFVIVLGVAAVVSSLARPPEGESESSAPSARKAPSAPATAAPIASRSGGVARIEMTVGGRRERRTLEAGRPTTLVVHVKSAGEIEIPDLGLVQPAEPLTPARFDLYVGSTGKRSVVYRPATGEPSSVVGSFTVESD